MPVFIRQLSATCVLLVLVFWSQPAASQTPSRTETRKAGEISGNVSPLEMKTQLDAFASALEREPDARGHLFFYIGQNLPGAAFRLLSKAENYLRKFRYKESQRLVVSHAGMRKDSTVELWIVAPDSVPQITDSTPPFRDYTAGFKWDEMYYLLQEERAAMSGKEPQALDSNYFDNQSSWLDQFSAELTFPQSPRGMIVIHPKRGDPQDLPGRIAEYQKRYMLRYRAIDPAKISLKIGEQSERRKVELWLLPAVAPIKYAEFVPADAAQTESWLYQVANAMRDLKGVLQGSKVYVIAYTGMIGDSNLVLTAQASLASLKNRLIQEYKLDPNRIVIIDGGRQKESLVELWLVPPDALEPQPKLVEP